MPIREETRHLYPPPDVWRELRSKVLARAEHECECVGQCGHAHDGGRCSVPNRAVVYWTWTWHDRATQVKRWAWHHHVSSAHDGAGRTAATKVVLTLAHLDQDPTHNDLANLLAMCQRCHLALDRGQHAVNAAETRARKRAEAAGQQVLPGTRRMR